jgi:hypothetical protein
MECITIDKILALTQGRMPAEEAERIRNHLESGCSECREQSDQLREALAATADQMLSEPPEWLTNQAKSLFAWHREKSFEDNVTRVPAVLLVDSFAAGQLVGFRSAGSMGRQMLYRAGGYNINLSINYLERARSIDVMGQPMPLHENLRSLAGADVEMHKDSIICATKSNEFGAFLLGGIPEGIYELKIKSEDEELDIVELNAVVCPH